MFEKYKIEKGLFLIKLTFFCEICEVFKNIYLEEHLRKDCLETLRLFLILYIDLIKFLENRDKEFQLRPMILDHENKKTD